MVRRKQGWRGGRRRCARRLVRRREYGHWAEQQRRTAEAILAARAQNEASERSIAQQRADLDSERQLLARDKAEMVALSVDLTEREERLRSGAALREMSQRDHDQLIAERDALARSEEQARAAAETRIKELEDMVSSLTQRSSELERS